LAKPTSSILLKAAFLQLSGILGAGIFVLPYVFHLSNFTFTLLGLIFLVLIMSQVHLFYCDIIARTPGDHQLAGYAKIYLGPRFQKLALLNIFLLGLGVLYAYIKLASSFITAIAPVISPKSASLVFVFLVGLFHLSRFRVFKNYSQYIPPLAILIILLLFSVALQIPSYPQIPNAPSLVFFGPLVFALTGFTIIPEVEEILRSSPRKRRNLRLATLAGLLLAAILYLIFAFTIGRLSGPYLSVDSVSGLSGTIPLAAVLLSILGLFLVFEATLNFILVFRETFYRDFQVPRLASDLLAFSVFIFSYLFLRGPLVEVISLTGAVTIFISALIICLIRLKLNRSPKLFAKSFIILLILFLGFLAEII
jgi:amino acid permease